MLNGLFGVKSGRRIPSSQYRKRNFDVAHEGPVSCVKRGGRPGTCISGGHDQNVVWYDYFSGTVVHVWTGHEQRVTKICHGGIVDMVASASKDRTIRLWTGDSREALNVIKAHDLPVTGLDFSPDNKMLCSGSRDNAVKIWDVSSGRLTRSSTVARNLVTHLVWASKPNVIVQTSEDRKLRFWDDRSLDVVTFPEKQHIQTHCDVTNDGNYVITGSDGADGYGCEATLWDVRKCRIMCEYKGHRRAINACRFISVAGNGPLQVVSVSQDGTLRLWNRDTTECLYVWSVDDGGAINDVEHLDDDSFGVAAFQTGIHRLLHGFHSSGRWVLKEVSRF